MQMHLQNAMKMEHILHWRKPSTRYDRLGQLDGQKPSIILASSRH